MRKFMFEASYSQDLQDRILPALSLAKTEGTLAGYDGKPLAFVRYDAAAPRGTVLILHGLNESTEKYREMIYYFLCEGLSVLIFDQRGHGRSHRAVRAGLVHVDRFEEYVKDALCVICGPLAACPAPYYLFAHSMGGAVAALLLVQGDHPFAKAVLSSPMIRTFRYPHVPPALVGFACRALSTIGFAKKGVSAHKKHGGEEDFANSCALSRVRFDAYAALKREHPAYKSGTITFGWTKEAIGVTRHILTKGAPERVGIPVRVYSAERDHLVEAAEQREFAARAPKGEFIPVAGAKHEIYLSNDEILHPYLDNVLDFFKSE